MNLKRLWQDRRKSLKELVSRLGFEPRTLALKGRCSTD
jgi:DNA-binding Xre family transcriptional regulator